jgi:hypothetical protein
MAMRVALLAFVLWVCPAFGGEVSDSSKIREFSKRILAVSKDLIETQKSLLRARDFSFSFEESRLTFGCLEMVYAAHFVVLYDLGPVAWLMDVRDVMMDQMDKTAARLAVETTLGILAQHAAQTQRDLNDTLVTCRRSTLAYDQAKSLLNVVRDVSEGVEPMLKRVRRD